MAAPPPARSGRGRSTARVLERGSTPMSKYHRQPPARSAAGLDQRSDRMSSVERLVEIEERAGDHGPRSKLGTGDGSRVRTLAIEQEAVSERWLRLVLGLQRIERGGHQR